MINEQRWKTNYIGLLEAGNCFYENVNCVCQPDTGSGGRGGARRRKRGAADRTSPAPQFRSLVRRDGERRTFALRPPMGRNFLGLAFYGELHAELSPTTAPISVISNNKWL